MEIVKKEENEYNQNKYKRKTTKHLKNLQNALPTLRQNDLKRGGKFTSEKNLHYFDFSSNFLRSSHLIIPSYINEIKMKNEYHSIRSTQIVSKEKYLQRNRSTKVSMIEKFNENLYPSKYYNLFIS